MVRILWELIKNFDCFEDGKNLFGLLEIEVNGKGFWWDGTLDMREIVNEYADFSESICEDLYAYFRCLSKNVLTLKDGQTARDIPPYSAMYDVSYTREGNQAIIRKNQLDSQHNSTEVIYVELEETVPFAELEAEIKRSVTRFVKEVGERSPKLKDNTDLLALLD